MTLRSTRDCSYTSDTLHADLDVCIVVKKPYHDIAIFPALPWLHVNMPQHHDDPGMQRLQVAV